MAAVFAELLAFFGISGAPATFAEFVPWFMSVLCCIGFFLFCFGMIKSMVNNVSRTRW